MVLCIKMTDSAPCIQINTERDSMEKIQGHEIKQIIKDLKDGCAAIIDCPRCEKNSFIGIAQGFSSTGGSYPIGMCCYCDMNLKELDSKNDLLLLMEFRNTNWDKWLLFCLENGFQPELKQG